MFFNYCVTLNYLTCSFFLCQLQSRLKADLNIWGFNTHGFSADGRLFWCMHSLCVHWNLKHTPESRFYECTKLVLKKQLIQTLIIVCVCVKACSPSGVSVMAASLSWRPSAVVLNSCFPPLTRSHTNLRHHGSRWRSFTTKRGESLVAYTERGTPAHFRDAHGHMSMGILFLLK